MTYFLSINDWDTSLGQINCEIEVLATGYFMQDACSASGQQEATIYYIDDWRIVGPILIDGYELSPPQGKFIDFVMPHLMTAIQEHANFEALEEQFNENIRSVKL